VGAALATTISMFFKAVVVYIASVKIHNHGFPIMKTIILSSAMAFSLLGPLYFNDMFLSQTIRVFSMISVLMLHVIFFKQEIINVIVRVVFILRKN
jgi:hypothetical protein